MSMFNTRAFGKRYPRSDVGRWLQRAPYLEEPENQEIPPTVNPANPPGFRPTDLYRRREGMARSVFETPAEQAYAASVQASKRPATDTSRPAGRMAFGADHPQPMAVQSPMVPQPKEPVSAPAPQAPPADDYGKKRTSLNARLMQLRSRMNSTAPGSSERVALANEIRGVNQTIKALDYSRTTDAPARTTEQSVASARALFEQGRAMYEGDVQPSPESRRAERDRFAQMYFYKSGRPDLAVRPNRAELLEASGVSIPVSSGLADTMGRMERREANSRSLADIESGDYAKRLESPEYARNRARAAAARKGFRDAAGIAADRGIAEMEANVAGESAASELRAARTAAATAQERAKAKIAESEAQIAEGEAYVRRAQAGLSAARTISEVKIADAGNSFLMPVSGIAQSLKWANENPNAMSTKDGQDMIREFNRYVGMWNKLPDDLKGAAAIKIVERLGEAGVKLNLPTPSEWGSMTLNPFIEPGSAEWADMQNADPMTRLLAAALTPITTITGGRTATAAAYNRRQIHNLNSFMAFLREVAGGSTYVSPREQ